LHNREKKKTIFSLRKKEEANGLCSGMVEESVDEKVLK